MESVFLPRSETAVPKPPEKVIPYADTTRRRADRRGELRPRRPPPPYERRRPTTTTALRVDYALPIYDDLALCYYLVPETTSTRRPTSPSGKPRRRPPWPARSSSRSALGGTSGTRAGGSLHAGAIVRRTQSLLLAPRRSAALLVLRRRRRWPEGAYRTASLRLIPPEETCAVAISVIRRGSCADESGSTAETLAGSDHGRTPTARFWPCRWPF